MDFSDTYAPVGKLTTFRYLIYHIRRFGWNMDHLVVVAAFLNPEMDDDDLYMTLPDGLADGSNATKIVVSLRKALYGLNQAPQLRHEDINTILLSLGFTKSSADPNLYLRGKGILILLYVDAISMLYPHRQKCKLTIGCATRTRGAHSKLPVDPCATRSL